MQRLEKKLKCFLVSETGKSINGFSIKTKYIYFILKKNFCCKSKRVRERLIVEEECNFSSFFFFFIRKKKKEIIVSYSEKSLGKCEHGTEKNICLKMQEKRHFIKMQVQLEMKFSRILFSNIFAYAISLNLTMKCF